MFTSVPPCLLVAAVDLVAEQAAGQAEAVAPDVAKAVYALAAASGSETAYDTLVTMYEQVRQARTPRHEHPGTDTAVGEMWTSICTVLVQVGGAIAPVGCW